MEYIKTLLIITGWTRGLGEGILRAYADTQGRELAIVGLARSRNSELQGQVSEQVAAFHHISADLGDPSAVNIAIEELGRTCSAYIATEKKILINNAAILDPICTLQSITNCEEFFHASSQAFAVNCIAPALLSGFFINQICTLGDERTRQANHILNISSGASQGPMPGAAIYSMTKSALNSLNLSILRDLGNQAPAVKVIALSPGMVETAMQEDLRSRSEKQFPNVEYFRDAARKGSVASHLEIGRRIASLNYDELESGSYYHIGDLK